MKALKSPTITLAILCAVGTHMLLFTDMGHRLQSSATESLVTQTADTDLSIEGDQVIWRAHRDLSIQEIRGTLQYDTTSLFLDTGSSTLGDLSETALEWGKSVTLRVNTVQKGDILASWTLTSVVPEIHTVNLTDVVIISETGAESLSASGTGEF